jgi:hypothetical protein
MTRAPEPFSKILQHAGAGQRGEQVVDFMRLRCFVDAIHGSFNHARI